MAKSLDIIDPKKDISDRSEDDSKDSKDLNLDPPKKERGSGGGVFYLVLGIIAILVATAAALFILFKEDGSTKDPNLSSTTATVEPSPSTTATESAEIATPENPSPEATFKYTDESIRIANGNGISGEASKIKGILEDRGYKVASVGNASRSYTESIIYFKTGQDKLAEALKKDLDSEYKFTTELADQVVGSYDAVVVLGSK